MRRIEGKGRVLLTVWEKMKLQEKLRKWPETGEDTRFLLISFSYAILLDIKDKLETIIFSL